jgi:hypothetical protein
MKQDEDKDEDSRKRKRNFAKEMIVIQYTEQET